MSAFGRLQLVDARDAWTHEVHDFTPWLSANLDRLADVIGVPLELEDSEVRVERFAADILARCPLDRRVLIENQLTPSDHLHLGQIMTYLAGLEAKIMVWIAPDFRDPHLSAIKWLNDHTAEDFAFFAVRLQVMRIADSPLAPVFEVIERPNAWEKQLRQATPERAGMSEIGQFRQRFWRHLFTRHPAMGEAASAWAQSWHRLSLDGTDLSVTCFISKRMVGVFVRAEQTAASESLLVHLAPVAEQLQTRLGTEIGESSISRTPAAAISSSSSASPTSTSRKSRTA